MKASPVSEMRAQRCKVAMTMSVREVGYSIQLDYVFDSIRSTGQ
jgi:hypothetical protein